MNDTPAWLERDLNLWADTWMRRNIADAAMAHTSDAALVSSLDQDGHTARPGVATPVFTGEMRRDVVEAEFFDLRGPNGRKQRVQLFERMVIWSVRWDSSYLGKYEGKHLEHRVGGQTHDAFIRVELFLSGFRPARVDERSPLPVDHLARIALLMHYPTQGPNEGVAADEWVRALKRHRPELYALLPEGRQSRELNRLRLNLEWALKGSEKALGRVRKRLSA